MQETHSVGCEQWRKKGAWRSCICAKEDNVFDLTVYKREKKAKTDSGLCQKCGFPRPVCSPNGVECRNIPMEDF